MLVDTPAIVLTAVQYSDSNSIVHAYTSLFGSVSYLVSRSVRRRSGGLRAMFIPLAQLHLTTEHRSTRDIQRVREATILHAPMRASVDPVANAISLFLADLLDKILRMGGSDAMLFQFVSTALVQLETVDRTTLASFHLRFMVELSAHLGILPDRQSYAPGDILAIDEGAFRAPITHAESEALAAPSALLVSLLDDPEKALGLVCRDERNALLDLLLRYLDHYYPGTASLRSPSVLQTLF